MTTAELRSLAAFRYEIRRFLVFSENAARAAGLEPRHHQLLLAIAGLPEGERPTIGVLAERLALKHHSVVELVGRSVRQGLVERERAGREVLVRLTERGREALDGLAVAHRDELRTAGPRLGQALAAVLAGVSA